MIKNIKLNNKMKYMHGLIIWLFQEILGNWFWLSCHFKQKKSQAFQSLFMGTYAQGFFFLVVNFFKILKHFYNSFNHLFLQLVEIIFLEHKL